MRLRPPPLLLHLLLLLTFVNAFEVLPKGHGTSKNPWIVEEKPSFPLLSGVPPQVRDEGEGILPILTNPHSLLSPPPLRHFLPPPSGKRPRPLWAQPLPTQNLWEIPPTLNQQSPTMQSPWVFYSTPSKQLLPRPPLPHLPPPPPMQNPWAFQPLFFNEPPPPPPGAPGGSDGLQGLSTQPFLFRGPDQSSPPKSENEKVVGRVLLQTSSTGRILVRVLAPPSMVEIREGPEALTMPFGGGGNFLEDSFSPPRNYRSVTDAEAQVVRGQELSGGGASRVSKSAAYGALKEEMVGGRGSSARVRGLRVPLEGMTHGEGPREVFYQSLDSSKFQTSAEELGLEELALEEEVAEIQGLRGGLPQKEDFPKALPSSQDTAFLKEEEEEVETNVSPQGQSFPNSPDGVALEGETHVLRNFAKGLLPHQLPLYVEEETRSEEGEVSKGPQFFPEGLQESSKSEDLPVGGRIEDFSRASEDVGYFGKEPRT